MSRRTKRAIHWVGRFLALTLLFVALGAGAFVYRRWVTREQRFNQLIESVATQYNVDKFLVKAVIHRESEFDPTVLGRAGEIGLMQVTPGAARDWARATGQRDFTTDSLWNPRVNIEAGTWYLGRALGRWKEKDNPVPFALAEYNAGFGNVLRWLPRGQATTATEFCEAITFPGVRRYIETVEEYYLYYQTAGNW